MTADIPPIVWVLLAVVVVIFVAAVVVCIALDVRDEQHDAKSVNRFLADRPLSLMEEDRTDDPTDDELTASLPTLREEAVGFRPHTTCVDRWFDHEPHRVHQRCRAAIVAAMEAKR